MVRLSRSGDRPFRLSVPEFPSHAYRFHSPLIKPDVPVSGIRLSCKRIHAFVRERLVRNVASRMSPRSRWRYMGA